jgi:hypothetical protein
MNADPQISMTRAILFDAAKGLAVTAAVILAGALFFQ